MGFYAVYSRELLLLRKKIGRMGYVFSSVISPFIYLFAFGYGLGNRIEITGGYLPFLAGGIIGVTVMINAFQQTASSISAGKFYYHVFQSLVLSPVRSGSVIAGIIAAGMVRALFFGSLIFIMAQLVFQVNGSILLFLFGALLGSFCFSALGVIVGLLVRHPDDIAIVNNFLIMPMTFFGGSFFPVQSLPVWMQYMVGLFPIGALNHLLRGQQWDFEMWLAASLLLGLGIIFFAVGVYLYRQYSE